MTDKIVQCVPNYSEGRDVKKVQAIVNCFTDVDGVKLLDFSSDSDHNRTVITVAGCKDAVLQAVIQSVRVAKDLIDLNCHIGQHPRMGAVDVIPFIAIKNITEQEVQELVRQAGRQISELDIPVYFYERSATAKNRENLADIRKGQFEGLIEKMKDPQWMPDCGKPQPHPTFGAVAVGMRPPLVAFNVNLDTDKLEIADRIARRVRFSGGGLRFVKAMGVELTERRQTQVSMNLTDYTNTPLYSALEFIRMEARRYGVSVVGSEVIGLTPLDALLQSAEYYLQLKSCPQICFEADVEPITIDINLNTDSLNTAHEICSVIDDGELRFVQILSQELEDGQAQIKIRLNDYTQTPIHAVLEKIRNGASRHGVRVASTKMSDLPLTALVDSIEHYLQIENYSINQILEVRLNQ